MEQPKRKPNRLKNYDYSAPGAYFITICTKNRENLFWKNVGASIARPEAVQLSDRGEIVKTAILNINKCYPMITVDQYTAMPNHIHLLLQIHTDRHGKTVNHIPINVVIQQLKGYVTKQLGYSVWQKLYHDHVIRDEHDYQKIWNYIYGNPMKWSEDCFYTE